MVDKKLLQITASAAPRRSPGSSSGSYLGPRSSLLAKHLPAQLLGEPHEPVAFLWCDRDPLGKLGSQDLVLDLQELDLPGQLFLRCTGNHKQQRLKDVRHRGKMRKSIRIIEMRSFWHPGGRFIGLRQPYLELRHALCAL